MTFPWAFRLAFAVLELIALPGCSLEAPPLPPPFTGPDTSPPQEDPPPPSQEDPPPPPLPCTNPNPDPPPQNQPGIVLVGKPLRLEVMPYLPVPCSGQEIHRPTSVMAKVEGPNGEPVESQIALAPGGFYGILQFTPVHPGPHHILVAFSQTGGLHQFNLHAALDRSAEVSSQSLPVPCVALERTLQGAWVCDSAVLRDGAFAGVFSGARLAVSGNVIWVVDESTVRRYLDTGTSLVQMGAFTHQRGAAEFLLAAADELVVLHASSLVLYTFQDGVVTSGGVEPWTRPSLPIRGPPYGVLVREGDRLAIVTRGRLPTESAIQVCPYQLLSGRFQRTPGDCPLHAGNVIGFEPGVLWTQDDSVLNGIKFHRGHVRRWLWTGGQLVEQGALAPGFNADILDQPLMRSAVVPLLRDAAFIDRPPHLLAVATWYPEKKRILLEHLDAQIYNPSIPPLHYMYASPSLYWGRPINSPTPPDTKIRLRPPLP